MIVSTLLTLFISYTQIIIYLQTCYEWSHVKKLKKYKGKKKQSGDLEIVQAKEMTIHKSQGSTYKYVVVHTNNNQRLRTRLLYVAMSRVTSVNELFIAELYTSNQKLRILIHIFPQFIPLIYGL